MADVNAPEAVRRAQTIVETYLRLTDSPQACDVLLILGTWDDLVPEYGVSLLRQGISRLAIVSGARGELTRDSPSTEAERARSILVQGGIPPHQILVEPLATNTWENIRNSLAVGTAVGVSASASWGLVCREVQSLRTSLTFEKVTGRRPLMFPPPNTLYNPIYGSPQDYLFRLCGELRRIEDYTRQGDIAPTQIPERVYKSWALLEGWIDPGSRSE